MVKFYILGENHRLDAEEIVRIVADFQHFYMGTEHCFYPFEENHVYGFEDFISKFYSSVIWIYFNLHKLESDPQSEARLEIQEVLHMLQGLVQLLQRPDVFTVCSLRYDRMYCTKAFIRSLTTIKNVLDACKNLDDPKLKEKFLDFMSKFIAIIPSHQYVNLKDKTMLDLTYLQTYPDKTETEQLGMLNECFTQLRDVTSGFIISCLMKQAKQLNQDAVFIVGRSHLKGLQLYLNEIEPHVVYCKDYEELRALALKPKTVTRDLSPITKMGITSSASKAEQYKLKGNELFKKGSYQEALTCYKLAVSLNANFKEAWLNMAKSQYKLGQTQEALVSAKTAKRIDPTYENAVKFIQALQGESKEEVTAAPTTV